VLFTPSCPGYTGLTGALDRSDQCESLVAFASGERLGVFVVVPCCCCFEFGSVWSLIGLFGVLGLSGRDRSDRCAASV
jgi:hypothetical protein